MGHLIYGVAPAINIDDWALHHLQAVMLTKLRRDESFSFSWDDEPGVGGDDAISQPGRHGTVWVSKSSSLYFSFDHSRQDPLNGRWLAILAQAASSSHGLRLLPEPPDPASTHPGA
jgi:hypothetical protein